MSECSLSGRGQGHVSNFYIVDLENFATASRRYTGTIQYNIRLLEAVRTQRRTIIEREKYVENENVKKVTYIVRPSWVCL